MLLIGSIIKSNYSDRLHQIVQIHDNCKCAQLTDQLGLTDSEMKLESPSHFHLTCIDQLDHMKSYFNGYVIDNMKIFNIWRPNDEITIISQPSSIQLTLF